MVSVDEDTCTGFNSVWSFPIISEVSFALVEKVVTESAVKVNENIRQERGFTNIFYGSGIPIFISPLVILLVSLGRKEALKAETIYSQGRQILALWPVVITPFPHYPVTTGCTLWFGESRRALLLVLRFINCRTASVTEALLLCWNYTLQDSVQILS